MPVKRTLGASILLIDISTYRNTEQIPPPIRILHFLLFLGQGGEELLLPVACHAQGDIHRWASLLKKVMITSLIRLKILKNNDYFATRSGQPKKITIILLLVTCLPKKVLINSLLVTAPKKKY
jgi:hypothetical protein